MRYETQAIVVEHVIALLQRFIGESAYRREVKADGVARVVGLPNVLTIVAYADTEPVGLTLGMSWEHPLFTGKPVSDLLVYVVPEHRGGMAGVRMIRMLEAWARKRGADGMMLGQSTGVGDIERVRALYERMGYRLTGVNAMKEF